MSGCIPARGWGGLWDNRPPAPPGPHPRQQALRAICGHLRTLPPAPLVNLAPLLAAVRDAEQIPPNIEILSDLRPVAMAQDAAVRVAMAAGELLRNAATHAFAPSAGGDGYIGFHLWPVDRLPGVAAFAMVSDNGCGFGAEPPPGSRSGLAVARRMVRRAGGTLARSACSGTVWHLAIPPADARARPPREARVPVQPFNPVLRRLPCH